MLTCADATPCDPCKVPWYCLRLAYLNVLARFLHVYGHVRTHAGVLLAPITATRAATPLGVDPATNSPGSASDAPTLPPLPEPWSSEAEAARSREIAQVLLSAVKAYGLEDCWKWKPLLDGKQVRGPLYRALLPAVWASQYLMPMRSRSGGEIVCLGACVCCR